MAGYRTAVRYLENGQEGGQKVMVRTAIPNGPREILDGNNWRPVKPAERFVPVVRRVPQVENDWVR